MKPLRIGPFKIINKISNITYEIVNQDGYTSHIHRNHLIPYYPKEPIFFPFLQQYNSHLFNDNYSNKKDQIIDSNENQFSDEDFLPQNLIKKRIYHPQSTSNQNHLANILHFRTNKKNKILKIPTQITNQTFMTMIILITPEDTPIIDTISAHNQEKTIDFSLEKRI